MRAVEHRDDRRAPLAEGDGGAGSLERLHDRGLRLGQPEPDLRPAMELPPERDRVLERPAGLIEELHLPSQRPRAPQPTASGRGACATLNRVSAAADRSRT